MSNRNSLNFLEAIALPFALVGFAVAEPLFELLRQNPEFFTARHNSPADAVAVTIFLSFGLPLIMMVPLLLSRSHNRSFRRLYRWSICTLLAGLLFAQLLRDWSDIPTLLFIALLIGPAWWVSRILLFSRWKLLALVLFFVALTFPIRFLFWSDAVPRSGSRDASAITLPISIEGVPQDAPQDAPDIVFVVFDELPIATLLDAEGEIDASFFTGFNGLQKISNNYINTVTAANSTTFALPAILEGTLPDYRPSALNDPVAGQKPNLFTLLRDHYSFNVAETHTRLCPQDLCPRPMPGGLVRFRTLLLDLTAVYLHRITPTEWIDLLPDISTGWSNFFASGDTGFDTGGQDNTKTIWGADAHGQDMPDRPAWFRQFISSIAPADKPVLNFVHVPFPHSPFAYLPDGTNYGRHWLRGQSGGTWLQHEWSLVTARQRHFLQAQLADRLLADLLDHLKRAEMLEDSLVVVVADHGIGFAAGDRARSLTGQNAASLLRVPLFIKAPGQTQGRRVDKPVMTIDILPTIVTLLNSDPSLIRFDGISLALKDMPESRTRYASANGRTFPVDERDMAVGGIVADNRLALKLDDNTSAIWHAGPYDQYRGKALSYVCDPKPGSLRYRFGKNEPVPFANPDSLVPAFIHGSLLGKFSTDEPVPFIISSNGLIEASGFVMKLREKWRFSALVHPDLVLQPDWSPEISVLVVDGQCLQK